MAVQGVTNSSVSGVIFFSSISSSAKFFLYFSQLEPVAEGCAIVRTSELTARAATKPRGGGVGLAYHGDWRRRGMECRFEGF